MGDDIVFDNIVKYMLKDAWKTESNIDRYVKFLLYEKKSLNVSLKTNDSLIVFAITGKKYRSNFESIFDTWKKNKDDSTCQTLLKLLFLGDINNNSKLKSFIKQYCEITSIDDINKNKNLFVYLSNKYLNSDLKYIKIESSILSLLALLFSDTIDSEYYEQLSNLIKTSFDKLSIFEKIGLFAFSTNKKFTGVQLTYDDSIEFLKQKKPLKFYKYMKSNFLKLLKEYKMIHFINTIPLLIIAIKLIPWIKLGELTWEFLKIEKVLPWMLNLSYPTLIITFLSLLSLNIIFRLLVYFRRLKEI